MRAEQSTRLVFDAIGTSWQIDCDEPIEADTASRVEDRIERFDAIWSRFRADSAVSELALSAGSRDFGPDAQPLFELFERLTAVTDGAVTPVIGDALNRLGYDATYSFVAASGPSVPAPNVKNVLRVTGSVVDVTTPITIDIGAVGKGYLVDRVADILAEAGHGTFTVDASGDIAHRGQPIRVALEHPYDPALAIGVVTLASGALCASATNRRMWGNGLHHVIDGRTGSPVDTVVATWATASDAATADGLATALFFEPPGAIVSSFDAEGLRMLTSGRIERSPGFPGEVFS